MIGIVGAGISGLALAHHLRAAGLPHVVIEAADRPGGVIRADMVAGKRLECGPQRARMDALMGDLIDELGLRDRVITAPPGLPLFVLRGSRLRRAPRSLRELLAGDILSRAGKARLLLEPFTAAARDDETVAAFFSRKLGREAYENLIGPLYGGLYASDPANMVVGLSVRHTLRELEVQRSLLVTLMRRGGRIEPPAAFSFEDGLQVLTDALCAHNRSNIRLNVPARSIQRTAAGLRIEAGDDIVDVDAVVLTLPADAAATLIEPLAPDAAGRLRTLRYNPLAIVHLLADTELRGLGYQVSLAENTATRGVTWNDCLFGRQGVYTAYLGGARMPDVVDLPDGELGSIAAEEFERATGYPARPISVARARMPAWDRSWVALRGLAWPHGVHICANWWSRPGIPGRLHEAKQLAYRLIADAEASRSRGPALR